MRWVLVCVSMLVACEHGKGGGMVPPDAGGPGATCGGFAGTRCVVGEFCDFGPNTCGGTDETGTCRPQPTACPDVVDPVCGCDGQIHGNECEANASGFDVNATGSCAVDPGEFACGFRVCSLATSYCQRAASDVGGEPDGFSCIPLPIGCGSTPSCACLTSEPCGSLCSGDAANGLELLCPGG